MRSVVIYLTPSLDTMTESVSASGAREVGADLNRNAKVEHDRGDIVVDSTTHDGPSVQAL